jgi:hypothetical protein
MENVTLSSQELSNLKKSFACIFGAFAASIIAVKWNSELALGDSITNILRAFTTALTVTVALFWLFYKWCWKMGPIPKLLGRPAIEGIWIGQLRSDYARPAGIATLEKNIVFIVRQTYITLSIQSLTDTQVGESKVEALIKNKRVDTTRLAYVFELKNEYMGSTTLVNGAGDLQLHLANGTLSGSYWTNSPTRGTICLRRMSNKCDGLENFQDAVNRWPDQSTWIC